ncbi:hypothetical protein BKD30_00245 [Tersicoccus phoenicis]|uniref:Uncharacterized protein n=1 Tax=Tersicoccus phoenicis TaxID=554083 RepID=A0A1R1LQ53_9MICC|nr:hypothetical protein [Tersicoccus phoenicis]OMH29664.1 hypothetical protein BKD30_00245 [Tersicoccus phoenicis]
MSPDLVLADPGSAEDLRTFVARARQVNDAGIRLAVTGSVLAATVCVLRPPGLGESGPTVLGLRTMALADDSADGLDVTVPLGAVADRLARAADAGDDAARRRLPIPPTTLTEPWAGVGAPQRGWERLGVAPAGRLREAARHGIDLVRTALPQDAGSAVLQTVRRAVLAAPTQGLLAEVAADSGVQDVPLAAAYAAELLGFLGPAESTARPAGRPTTGAPTAGASPAGEDMAVFGRRQWLRLSNPRGHVVVKS